MQDKGKERQIQATQLSQHDLGVSTQDLGGSLPNLGKHYHTTSSSM
jgi:hypothetical protein